MGRIVEYSYRMELWFDQPVTQHHFTVRCKPQDTERQQILKERVRIYPNYSIAEAEDSFGNSISFGRMEEPHELFTILSEGIAEVGQTDWEEKTDSIQAGIFRFQTPMTQPGRELLTFYQSFYFPVGMDSYNRAMNMMERLHDCFRYQPGTTTIDTTAEEAFAQRKGVCQDYAHILLSLCRLEKIPARYVVGLLQGEGQSHAWVEIWQDGKFYPIDPTNRCKVNLDHLRISVGRDYNDCRINQGTFTGLAHQTRRIQAFLRDLPTNVTLWNKAR